MYSQNTCSLSHKIFDKISGRQQARPVLNHAYISEVFIFKFDKLSLSLLQKSGHMEQIQCRYSCIPSVFRLIFCVDANTKFHQNMFCTSGYQPGQRSQNSDYATKGTDQDWNPSKGKEICLFSKTWTPPLGPPNLQFNPLPPNDIYMCRTAPLTSRRCILYIYSTNIRTEYFKHAAHSPFFPLQNAVYFIMLPFLVPVLFTF